MVLPQKPIVSLPQNNEVYVTGFFHSGCFFRLVFLKKGTITPSKKGSERSIRNIFEKFTFVKNIEQPIDRWTIFDQFNFRFLRKNRLSRELWRTVWTWNLIKQFYKIIFTYLNKRDISPFQYFSPNKHKPYFFNYGDICSEKVSNNTELFFLHRIQVYNKKGGYRVLSNLTDFWKILDTFFPEYFF